VNTNFTEDQVSRYARHILLKEVGGIGQAKMLNSRVLVIGAGGLGSPVMLYLAAAGIGTIGVIDDDHVDLSNLQRQILHATERVGFKKVDSASEGLKSINPEITIEKIYNRLTEKNAKTLIESYDIVVDGSDNFSTRFLVNDACYLFRRTLVSAAILRFDGQLGTFKAHILDKNGEHGPCYRCIFRAPPQDHVPTCAEAGVMGALCGLMGSLQASEVIKELLGIGDSMSGFLMIVDGLATEFRKISVKADPECPLCGVNPVITDLSTHRELDANCAS
jgi:molybdopterin-synthase adenylyltransferase